MECKLIKYIQKRRDKNKKDNRKVWKCKLGDYCLKRILYWFGIGLELLSACLVAEVCQASKVFLMRKEPLSMTLELSKSMQWSNGRACFAMFDPLAHVLTFLMCSFLRVYPSKAIDSESLMCSFLNFLASERFYLFNLRKCCNTLQNTRLSSKLLCCMQHVQALLAVQNVVKFPLVSQE